MIGISKDWIARLAVTPIWIRNEGKFNDPTNLSIAPTEFSKCGLPYNTYSTKEYT